MRTRSRVQDEGHEALLILLLGNTFFNGHVLELVRVKDLAAVEAFNIFSILFACYDANLGVFAGRVHGVVSVAQIR